MNKKLGSSSVFYRRLSHGHPTIVRGEGVYLYDQQGKCYLDGSGGALVANIGHGVKQIAEAMAHQASQAAYIHGTMFTSQVNEQYAHELARIAPLIEPKFYFLTSGSEAVEAAIKFVRQVQIARGQASRYMTISRQQSYHGASLGALAVTGKPKMRKPFESLFIDMPKIPPPYCYRCTYELKHPQCNLRCAQALEIEINRIGADKIAAFIAEPVSGATLGAVVPPPDYWPKIREICDRYEVLLIADEVMSGMGRTGQWFAINHWQVEPDIITIGKGCAGGYFPLSAMAVKGELLEELARGQSDFIHGGTYSHHTVGCAAGLATLDYLKSNNLVEGVARKGAYLQSKLRDSLSPFEWIGDMRGIGLMWGVELVKERKNKTPFTPDLRLGAKLCDEAFRRGLILYPGSGCVDGVRGDHFMIGPPFTITKAQIDELVALLEAAVLAIDLLYIR